MRERVNGLRVAAFESRRAKEIEDLIVSGGGVPSVAPSMLESPVKQPGAVWDFASRLFGGKTDVLILLTATGAEMMSELIISKYGRREYVNALGKIRIVCRGPKTVSALKGFGVTPETGVSEPATWREIVSCAENAGLLRGARVEVQQSGAANPQLMRALKKRGAKARSFSVYKWKLPENTGRLENIIREVAAGKQDAVLFTSSQQVVNVMKTARRAGIETALKKGLSATAVGSVGPSTTATLKRFGIPVDHEPDGAKMDTLVTDIMARGGVLAEKKRRALKNGVDTLKWKRIDMVWSRAKRAPAVRDSLFMKACRLEKTARPPVWIMRQAGRYLREYREVRAKVPFLELCKTPELAAEVTLMPVDKFGFDAAIIFADILLILEPLGIKIEFSKGDGPRIKNTARTSAAVDALREFDPSETGYVCDAIKIVRRALTPQAALLGFAGAPFTVASYLIEGGGSSTYANTKNLMRTDPGLWNALMEKLSSATAKYLRAQIEAGADAVQLFDSWAGCLTPDDYSRYVLPHTKAVFDALPQNVPAIHFAARAGSLLPLMKKAGGSVMGVDWTVDLAAAWKTVGHKTAIQGNLDPAVLLSSRAVMEKEVVSVLKKAGGRPGHIFNLGHGVMPATRAENVLALVEKVKDFSALGRERGRG
ncbi:MAG: uroporphyrinogen decarboxylase [Thermodesulfobacteriota bacterium]